MDTSKNSMGSSYLRNANVGVILLAAINLFFKNSDDATDSLVLLP